jgi:hypothetical protein
MKLLYAKEKEMSKSGDIVKVEEADVQIITEAQENAIINQQIATAKRYPRNIQDAKDELINLAASDPAVAEECFYGLARGGTEIEGPSVRLAELVEYCWGNIRVETRIIDIGEKFVTAQAQAADLERNNAVRAECKRRITDRNGKRYNDDLIQVTANAAAAIAYRNAIFKLVPPAVLKREFDQIDRARKDQSLPKRIEKAKKLFKTMKVEEANLLDYVGKSDWDEITHDDLNKLGNLATALKNGETTVEEVFPAAGPDTPEGEDVSNTGHSQASGGLKEAGREEIGRKQRFQKALDESIKKAEKATAEEVPEKEHPATAEEEDQEETSIDPLYPVRKLIGGTSPQLGKALHALVDDGHLPNPVTREALKSFAAKPKKQITGFRLFGDATAEELKSVFKPKPVYEVIPPSQWASGEGERMKVCKVFQGDETYLVEYDPEEGEDGTFYCSCPEDDCEHLEAAKEKVIEVANQES